MQGMTRRERQITDPERIVEILDTAKVLHLGLAAHIASLLNSTLQVRKYMLFLLIHGRR